LGRHRHRSEDREEMGREDADWVHLVHGRIQWRALALTKMNLWVP